MKRLWDTAREEALNTLFPHPERISPEERAARVDAARAEARKIGELKPGKNVSALLETARTVLADEDGRKTGAESRATAFLAAMATLIPLLTWAVGTANPVCSPGLGCGAWSAVFILAVFYLMAAGFWSLRTFAIDNYHCLAVEEVRQFAYDPEFELAIAKETLINARLNRDTINRKLVFIKCAQRCFYQALFLLAVLLMCDPIARFHMLSGGAPIAAGDAAPVAASAAQPTVIPLSLPTAPLAAAPTTPEPASSAAPKLNDEPLAPALDEPNTEAQSTTNP